MKPGEQFKIESIEELIEAYEKLKKEWWHRMSLEDEIKSFGRSNNYEYVTCDKNGYVYLFRKSDNYETIPNPFKKYSWERIKKALDGIGYDNLEEEKDPIREELNALRKEVEELKEEGNYLIPRIYLDTEIQEKYKEFCEKVKQGHFEEKPKESPDLKIKHISCELTLTENGFGDFVHIILKSNHNECHFCADKDEAIKIVDYLKNHFEI